MKLLLLISGVLLNILTVQSQPKWINHNGFWYMYFGPQRPPGAQPPRAAQVQQQQHQIPAPKRMITHGNPTVYNANRGPPITKALPAPRPAPPMPKPQAYAPTPPPMRAPPGNPMLQRQHAPSHLQWNGNYAPQRYPAFPHTIQFPSPAQRPPVQQRAPIGPPAKPLVPPPQPQPTIRNWGPVQIWNPVPPTPGYQHHVANHARPGYGPPHGPHPNYAVAAQPNMYPQRHPQPYPGAPPPPHSMYPYPLEGPDVDLRIIPCGASALIVTTPPAAGAAPAEPRCRCEDAQDCDIPSTTQDPLCPLWTTCCCQPLPPTVAPSPSTAAPAA